MEPPDHSSSAHARRSSDDIERSKTYNVSKLELLVEYFTDVNVIVDGTGFVEYRRRNGTFVFTDGTKIGQTVHLMHPHVADGGARWLRTSDLRANQKFFVPVEDGDDQSYNLVDLMLKHAHTRRCLRVHLIPDGVFSCTRVRIYWLVWTHRNALTPAAARWIVENAFADEFSLKSSTDNFFDTRRWNSGSTVFVLPRTLHRPNDVVGASADCACSWLPGAPKHSGVVPTSSIEIYLIAVQGTDLAEQFGRSAEQSGTIYDRNRCLAQRLVKLKFDLEQSLSSPRAQYMLCKFLSVTLRLAETRARPEALVAPFFARPLALSCDASTVDVANAYQNDCRDFLAVQETGAHNDTFVAEKVVSIRVASTGWRFDAHQCSLTWIDAHDVAVNGKQHRRRQALLPLCVACQEMQEDNVVYEMPLTSVDARCAIRHVSPPQSLWRAAFLSGGSGVGKRVAVLSHIVQDAHRSDGNLLYKSILEARKIHDLFGLMALRTALTPARRSQSAVRLCAQVAAGGMPVDCSNDWSAMRTRATLLLCSKCNVARWLAALGTLNDGVNLAIGRRRRNWFHVVDAASAQRVKLRLIVLRTLDNYWTLQFDDLLTADVILLTYELLGQIQIEACSYLGDFHAAEAPDAFSTDGWMECVRHHMNSESRRSIESLCGANGQLEHNVPLEAIRWHRLIVDNPPSSSDAELTVDEHDSRAAFDAFCRVVRFDRLLGIQSSGPTSVVDLHNAWRPLIWQSHFNSPVRLRRDVAVPNDVLLKCARRFPNLRESSAPLQRRTHVVYVTSSPQRSALFQGVFQLMCQLQDLQALREIRLSNTDGTLCTSYATRYPMTYCADVKHLKPSFRYILFWIEQNEHVAPIVTRNLCEQIMQRASRFLSQINVDYQQDSADTMINVNAESSDEASLASRAFHSMLRIRFRQQQQQQQQQQNQTQDENDNDSEFEQSASDESNAAEWDNHLTETAVHLIDDGSPESVDFIRDNVSTYSPSNNARDWEFLDDFDESSSVGMSSALGRTFVMQRSEHLRAIATLPYRTCVTSVRDRHLLTFLTAVANEPPPNPPSDQKSTRFSALSSIDVDGPLCIPSCPFCASLSDSGNEIDVDEDEEDEEYTLLEEGEIQCHTCSTGDVAAIPLNDYARFYRLHRPELLADQPGPFRISRRSQQPSSWNNAAPSDFASNIYDTEFGNGAAEAVVLQEHRDGNVAAESIADAVASLVDINRRMQTRYEITLKALRAERKQTALLLINAVRMLTAVLDAHQADPLRLTRAERRMPFLRSLCTRLFTFDQGFHNNNNADTNADEARVEAMVSACYAFYTDRIVADVLHPRGGAQQFEPPLSNNVRFLARQVAKFHRDTRWLRLDIAFVSLQQIRLHKNAENVHRTLEASRQNDPDTQEDCPVCLETFDDSADCAFYPCGHYCCWACHVEYNSEQHRVEDDEEPRIGAADSGQRCFHCRYVLQRGERVRRVHRSTRSSSQQSRASNSTPLPATPPPSTPLVHSPATEPPPPPPPPTPESDVPLAQSARKRAFIKTDPVLSFLRRSLEESSAQRPFRAIVASQFAPMLSEVHRALSQWLARTSKQDDVDVEFCPQPSTLLERQSRAPSLRCRRSGNRKRSRTERDEEEDDESRSRRSERSPLSHRCTRLQRDAIVFQHVDVTRYAFDVTKDDDFGRRALPLCHATHVIFVDAMCVRLTDDARAVQASVDVERRFLAPLESPFAQPNLIHVRFIVTGGVEAMLYQQQMNEKHAQRQQHRQPASDWARVANDVQTIFTTM